MPPFFISNQIMILPASGMATRIGGIPKALLPCGADESLLTRHISNSIAAAIEPVVVTRSDLVEPFRKHIANRFGDSCAVVPANTANMTQTVSTVLVQFPHVDIFSVFLPDTWINPLPPVVRLHDLASTHGVGLLVLPTRTDQAGKLGGVAFSSDGTVEAIRDKTPDSRFSSHHWGAVAFSRDTYMRYHDLSDPHVGMAVERYVGASGRAHAVVLNDATYYDFGTFAEVRAFMSRTRL